MSKLLLEGGQEYVPDEDSNDALLDEIARLEQRIQRLEGNLNGVKREAVMVVLNLFNAALRDIAAGKYDIADIPSADNNHKWDAIKQRMPPRHREAVDILLLQGSMKRTEIAAALKMNYTNCATNVIAVMIRQGWMIDNGGNLSLKEL